MITIDSSVTVALLGLFGVIVTAALGYLGVLAQRTHVASKAALAEVRNSHTTNLRDDLDKKFLGLADRLDSVTTNLEGVTTKVDTLSTDVGGLKKDVGGVKEDIRIIRRDQTADRQAIAEERERIRELEHTGPAKPTQNRRRTP